MTADAIYDIYELAALLRAKHQEAEELRRQIGELKAALAYIANPYGLTPLNQSVVPAEQWHRFAAYEHRVKFAQGTLERLG